MVISSKQILSLIAAGLFLPASAMAAGESPATSVAPTAPQQSAQPSPEQAQPLTQAEQWVLHRSEPWAIDQANERKQKKHPVRSILKKAEKGIATEAHQTFVDSAKDLFFVFSVQDVDPYDKSAPPLDKPAIVLEINLVDGSTCYLHRFPDDSFAVEGGFANNTVILPTKQHEFLVKYPNGATGKLVRSEGEYKIYRSDNSVTTISKNPSGDYQINNDKVGFMGTAHPDETGLQYELGTW